MSIVVTRIDERLIHGQVAYSWSVAYQVTEFIVIDDRVAADPTQHLLLSLAVPSGKDMLSFLSKMQSNIWLSSLIRKKRLL